jgi:hypothetical protein
MAERAGGHNTAAGWMGLPQVQEASSFSWNQQKYNTSPASLFESLPLPSEEKTLASLLLLWK